MRLAPPLCTHLFTSAHCINKYIISRIKNKLARATLGCPAQYQTAMEIVPQDFPNYSQVKAMESGGPENETVRETVQLYVEGWEQEM